MGQIDVFEIFYDVLAKYHSAINKLSKKDAAAEIDYMNKQLKKILHLLGLYKAGVISSSSIALLSNISFANFLNDKFIIESVFSNYIYTNKHNLFIKTSLRYRDDNHTFFRIIKRDGAYVAVGYFNGFVIERPIKLHELDEYVSVVKALEDSEYTGLKHKESGKVLLYDGKLSESRQYFSLFIDRDSTIKPILSSRPHCSEEFENIWMQSDSKINKKNIPQTIFLIESQLDEQYSDSNNGIKVNAKFFEKKNY